MNGPQIGGILLGLACLLLAAVCWSGKWPTWAENRSKTGPRAGPVTLVPGGGLIVLGIAVGAEIPGGLGAVLAVVGMLGAAILIVLGFWDPRWFGPRWYRGFKCAFAGRRAHPQGLTWMKADLRTSEETGVEATERHLASRRPEPPHQRVRLVFAPNGRLADRADGDARILYYPHAPVFVLGEVTGPPDRLPQPDPDKAPVNAIIPAELIRGAHKVTGDTYPGGTPVIPNWPWKPVYLDTAEGAWAFEVRADDHMVDEIHRRYLDDSRDMYGVKLPKSKRPTPATQPH